MTWSMLFNIVRAMDARVIRLLQILSLLNPGGILIGFLVAGADGVDAEHQNVTHYATNGHHRTDWGFSLK